MLVRLAGPCAIVFGNAVLQAGIVLAAGPAAVEVPFELVKNQIAFDVYVGGAGPFSFRLDSGIHPSVVSTEVAELAGLEPGPVAGSIAGFGSRQIGYRPVLVPTVAIGEFELMDLKAVVVDIPFAKERYGVDGVLGHSFLSRVVTQIDYPEEKLRFNLELGPKPDHGMVRHSVPLLSTGPGPRFDSLEVDGQPIRVALDTGASTALVLSDATVRQLSLEADRKKADVKTAYGARGAFETRVGKGADLSCGPFEVRNLPVSYAPPGHGENLLGNAFLKHYRLTLDYGQKMLILEQRR